MSTSPVPFKDPASVQQSQTSSGSGLPPSPGTLSGREVTRGAGPLTPDISPSGSPIPMVSSPKTIAEELSSYTCGSLPGPDKIVTKSKNGVLMPQFDHAWKPFIGSFSGDLAYMPFFSDQIRLDAAQAILDAFIQKNPDLQIKEEMDPQTCSKIKEAYPNLMMMALLLAMKSGADWRIRNIHITNSLRDVKQVSDKSQVTNSKMLTQIVNRWERRLLASINYEIPRLSTIQSLKRVSVERSSPAALLARYADGNFAITHTGDNTFTFWIKKNGKVRSVPFEVKEEKPGLATITSLGVTYNDLYLFFQKNSD